MVKIDFFINGTYQFIGLQGMEDTVSGIFSCNIGTNVVYLVGECHSNESLNHPFGDIIVELSDMKKPVNFIYEQAPYFASDSDIIIHMFEGYTAPLTFVLEMKENIRHPLMKFYPVDYRISSYLIEKLFSILYSHHSPTVVGSVGSVGSGFDVFKSLVLRLIKCFTLDVLSDNFKDNAISILEEIESAHKNTGDLYTPQIDESIVTNLMDMINLYTLISTNAILRQFFEENASDIYDYYINLFTELKFDYLDTVTISHAEDGFKIHYTDPDEQDEEQDEVDMHENLYDEFESESKKFTGFLIDIPAIIELGEVLNRQQNTISVLVFGLYHIPIINAFIISLADAPENTSTKPDKE